VQLDAITPIVLTYNEAPNIGRCLDRLRWAREVVVVDSYSTDETLALAANFPNVRVVQRAFDDFASQLQFGLESAGDATPWVLALDADYMVGEDFTSEVSQLAEAPGILAYRVRFQYAAFGRVLRGGAYPPVTVLFRRDRCSYRNDGHAYRLAVDEAAVVELRARFVHDDRKSLSRWLDSQSKYLKQEIAKMTSTPRDRLSRADRLRMKLVIVPPGVFFYSLFIRGGILDGWAGWFYALSRLVAESLISLGLLEHWFKQQTGADRQTTQRPHDPPERRS